VILYAISDRQKSPGGVVEWARGLLDAGVDMLQIREKDLAAGELYRVTREVLELRNPHGTRVLVNGRLDVALAAGAHGVHLPSGAPAPSAIRRIVPANFRIGVSCHTVEEVQRAEAEGADVAVFGPVFEPLSKIRSSTPAGLAGLREVCEGAAIPVLALGGITFENAIECQNRGAAGIAAISLFLSSQVSARETIRNMKRWP
jgi:thiamine-phosphate pyrophosphorylase